MFLKILLVLLSGASVLRSAPLSETDDFKNASAAAVDDVSRFRKLTRTIVRDVVRAARSDPDDGDVEMFERVLREFLGRYYDAFVVPPDVDIYDQMQSDQPTNDGFKSISVPIYNLDGARNGTHGSKSSKTNHSDVDRIMEDRNRGTLPEVEGRSKDNWVEVLKHNILSQIGRSNVTVPKTYIDSFNITSFMRNFSNEDDPVYTEKIRSYYPTCEIPKNTDQDLWKDENAMNLYFNVEYEKNVTIATATLRLYRLSQENLTDSQQNLCEIVQDERLLRISTYWYTKSLKRHRVKKRLCDSKVVGENTRWVELSVKSATKAWVKGGKNLGLAILVENQDGVTLKANQYFKGASCTLHQNLYQLSSSMRQGKTISSRDLIVFLEEIRRQPMILTRYCSLP